MSQLLVTTSAGFGSHSQGEDCCGVKCCHLLAVYYCPFPALVIELAKGNAWFHLQFWRIWKRELQGLRNSASPCPHGQEMGQRPAAEVRQEGSTAAAGLWQPAAESSSEPWARWAGDQLPEVQDVDCCDSAMPSSPTAHLGGQSNGRKWGVRHPNNFLHHTIRGIATRQELSWTNAFDSV